MVGKIVPAGELPPDLEVAHIEPGKATELKRKIRAGDLPPSTKIWVLDPKEAEGVEFGHLNPDGSVSLPDHPYPIPRMPSEVSRIDRLWKNIVDRLISAAHSVVRKRLKEPEKESVREIWRGFDMLIRAERDGKMKDRLSKARDLLCFLLENDPAYYWRAMYVLSRLDWGKFKFTDADRYWLGMRIDIEPPDRPSNATG